MTDMIQPITFGASQVPNILYKTISLKDIIIKLTPANSNNPSKIENMEIRGVDSKVHYSLRFMNSFLGLFGLSKSMFNLFDHDEVIDRIIKKGKGDKVRMALQMNGDNSYTSLAVIKPTKPFIESFDLYDLLTKMDIPESEITYTTGIVRSAHTPSVLGNSKMDIAGDQCVRRFMMDIPIDGYGNPSAYLSIIREVCSNGMIGEAPAFKSYVNIGDTSQVINGGIVTDAIPTIKKFIESHNNEEGFHILSERMRTAAETPASLNEFNILYKILSSIPEAHRSITGDASSPDLSSDLTSVMCNLAGADLMERYGLVSLDQISPKRRRLIPVECTVMDLINVASEVSTHRSKPVNSKKISGFIGQTLSQELDLEGTKAKISKSTDLYMVDYKHAHLRDDSREL